MKSFFETTLRLFRAASVADPIFFLERLACRLSPAIFQTAG